MKNDNRPLENFSTMVFEPFDSHPFHQFVQDIYQNAEANQALNNIYKKFSLCPELLLFLLWCSISNYGRLKRSYLQALHDSVFLWQRQVIQPLKDLLHPLQNGTHQSTQLAQFIQDEIHFADAITQALCYTTPTQKRLARRSAAQQVQDACYNLLQNYIHQNIELDEIDHAQNLKLLKILFAKQSCETLQRYYEQILNTLNLCLQQKMLQLRFGDI